MKTIAAVVTTCRRLGVYFSITSRNSTFAISLIASASGEEPARFGI